MSKKFRISEMQLVQAGSESETILCVQGVDGGVPLVATIELPIGAATSDKQDISNTSLSSIDTSLSSIDTSLSSIDTSLSSIDTKTPNVGQSNMAGSTPVVLASDQIVTIVHEQVSYDAFGRIRVSNPVTIFDSKQLYDNQPLIWDDRTITGSASSSYNANKASTTLSCANLTQGQRVRQTFRRFNYQPGKSQLVLMTGILGNSKTGNTKRLGQFDASNGFIWESNPSDIRLILRTKNTGTPSDLNFKSRVNWYDKMDGTGPSGLNVDFSKVQIFGHYYEWLGVGSVWFVLVINGKIWPVYRFDCANEQTEVYMSNPNLPLRYELTNDGTGPVDSITHICGTVITEGGFADSGVLRSVTNTTGLVTANNTSFYPLVAIQINPSNLGATIRPSNGSIICTSTSAYAWQLVLNPTVTGTAFSFSSITNSYVQADVARTNGTVITGGTVVASGVAQSVSESGVVLGLPGDLQLGSNILGTSDVLVLAVSRLTGNTETFYGSLSWREQG